MLILSLARFTGATEDMPPVAKKAAVKAAVMFSNITSGLLSTDTHNGLRAFNRRVADELQITCRICHTHRGNTGDVARKNIRLHRKCRSQLDIRIIHDTGSVIDKRS